MVKFYHCRCVISSLIILYFYIPLSVNFLGKVDNFLLNFHFSILEVLTVFWTSKFFTFFIFFIPSHIKLFFFVPKYSFFKSVLSYLTVRYLITFEAIDNCFSISSIAVFLIGNFKMYLNFL